MTRGNEPDAEMSEAFQKMFIAALLLTGSTARAECSILGGIRTLGRGMVSGDAVLHATLRAAVVQQVAIHREGSEIPDLYISGLPIELRRVLLLPEDLRRCFVLHLLVGLPLSECSRMLSLEACQVEQNIVSAAVALAGIRGKEAGSGVVEFRTTVAASTSANQNIQANQFNQPNCKNKLGFDKPSRWMTDILRQE